MLLTQFRNIHRLIFKANNQRQGNTTMGSISYRQGRIVFAYLRSSRTGKKENHPAVILTPDQYIVQPEAFDPRDFSKENSLYVIGVSTQYRLFKQSHILLPFAPDGHAVSKLKEECAAMIGWYHRIGIPDDIMGFGGQVPPAVMSQIVNAVKLDIPVAVHAEMQELQRMLHGPSWQRDKN